MTLRTLPTALLSCAMLTIGCGSDEGSGSTNSEGAAASGSGTGGNAGSGQLSVAGSFTLPSGLASGDREIDVAILDRAGQKPGTEPLPPLQLGIAGRRDDGWYSLSRLTVM